MPVVYGIYALFSLLLTIGLARVLFRHGQGLLDDVFEGRPEMAQAVNQLLVVGFYLVNFGYALLMMSGGRVHDVQSAVEALASKLGLLLMSLAAMHFANLYLFHRIRRRMRLAQMPPPVMHHGHVQAQWAPPASQSAQAWGGSCPA